MTTCNGSVCPSCQYKDYFICTTLNNYRRSELIAILDICDSVSACSTVLCVLSSFSNNWSLRSEILLSNRTKDSGCGAQHYWRFILVHSIRPFYHPSICRPSPCLHYRWCSQRRESFSHAHVRYSLKFHSRIFHLALLLPSSTLLYVICVMIS